MQLIAPPFLDPTIKMKIVLVQNFASLGFLFPPNAAFDQPKDP